MLLVSSIYNTIWMFSIIFFIFYLFILRPQIRKQKSEKNFQKSLKTGRNIVTNSGIHGRIIEIRNNFFIVETIIGKLKIEKNTVSKELTKLRYKNNKITN